MRSEGFVAVGLLTQRDLDVWGSGFRRAFPPQPSADFTFLLTRVDEADRLCTAARAAERLPDMPSPSQPLRKCA
jgi:hypothetical protein